MAYERTHWENNATALSAENMNNIEDGIEENKTAIATNSEDITTINQAITTEALKQQLIDVIYPVGSIYMSATLDTAAKVGAALGGTWVAWGAGRVPVGVGTSDRAFTANETGGSSNAIIPSHNHSFSGNAMTSHNHSQNSHTHTQVSHNHEPSGSSGLFETRFVVANSGSMLNDEGAALTGSGYYFPRTSSNAPGFKLEKYTISSAPTIYGATATNNAASAGTPSGTVGYTGEAVANKNLQPYITCYMYKRTA